MDAYIFTFTCVETISDPFSDSLGEGFSIFAGMTMADESNSSSELGHESQNPNPEGTINFPQSMGLCVLHCAWGKLGVRRRN